MEVFRDMSSFGGGGEPNEAPRVSITEMPDGYGPSTICARLTSLRDTTILRQEAIEGREKNAGEMEICGQAGFA